MRTNPDDLAADVAELDKRLADQFVRVNDLRQQLAAATHVLDRWNKLRSQLVDMAGLRQAMDSEEAEELAYIRKLEADNDF